MNGVVAVLQLLRSNADLLAIVPAARIAAGDLPVGTALPAISVKQVSSVDTNIPSPEAKRFVTDRVQITVMAEDYPQKTIVIAAAKRAAADQFYVDVPDISDVTVVTAGAGPDLFSEQTGIHFGMQDFMVRYNQER